MCDTVGGAPFWAYLPAFFNFFFEGLSLSGVRGRNATWGREVWGKWGVWLGVLIPSPQADAGALPGRAEHFYLSRLVLHALHPLGNVSDYCRVNFSVLKSSTQFYLLKNLKFLSLLQCKGSQKSRNSEKKIGPRISCFKERQTKNRPRSSRGPSKFSPVLSDGGGDTSPKMLGWIELPENAEGTFCGVGGRRRIAGGRSARKLPPPPPSFLLPARISAPCFRDQGALIS